MQIGLYKDKRTNEVLYFEQVEGYVWIATSFDGQKKIPVSEENNYQQIDYFQGRVIEKGLRRKAGWLEGLLDAKFEPSGEINSAEVLRQINGFRVNKPQEALCEDDGGDEDDSSYDFSD